MKHPWSMLFLIKHAYATCIHAVSKQYDLNVMECSILLLLAEDPALDTAQKVADTYHLSKSHVSTSLSALERKGFVQRLRNGQKQKNVRLKVLDPGCQAAAACRAALGELADRMAEGFSEEQAAFLKNSMETVMHNLQQYIQQPRKESDLP